jgi:TRAP-type C4-dicarboxylate transport system permease small subunit
VPPAAYPPPPPFGAAYPFAPPQTGNGYAIAALVLGLVSLILSWFPGVNWVLAALAIIFGAVGISTAGRRGGVGRGMAMAGLVLGVVTAVLGIVFLVVIYNSFAGSQCAYGC